MCGNEDCGPDEFDELDSLVEFAKNRVERGCSQDEKIYVKADMINLMLEEVHESDVRIYEQMNGSCIAEIKYRGFNFISVSPIKVPKPS